MATQQDLTVIQRTAEKLNENRVARFAYTEAALTEELADGVEAFDVGAEQNVPTKDHTDYDPMVLDKGVRSQGASIPRMGVNHFFGRTSYNLNLLIAKLTTFFSVLRRALAHNANEYDPQAEYATGDICYIVEIKADSCLYTWYRRVSASPLYIVNVSPTVSTTDWVAMDETTVANLASDELPLMAGTRSAGTSKKVARDDHIHPIDTSRAPNNTTLTDATADAALPVSGTVAAILQTVRNGLKWLVAAVNTKAPSASPTFTGTVTFPADGISSVTGVSTTKAASEYQALLKDMYLKAQMNCVIEGEVIFSSARVVTFTGRGLFLPMHKSIASGGYVSFSVDNFAAGTVIAGLGGATAITCSANGVFALPVWTAIILRHTPGGGTAAFVPYVVYYTDTSVLQANDLMLFNSAPRGLMVGGSTLVPLTGAYSAVATASNYTRGITQLTGDVTAPETVSGSAAATLAASGVTAAAYGDGGAARTLAFGGTFKVPGTLTVDAKGRITSAAAITLTMPANPNTDTDNRGITQLTGDVTAPSTVSGSAAATLANSGVTAAAYGDGGAARTLAFGGTFSIPSTLTVDAKGRITSAAKITITMPANPNTDNRGITQLTGDVTAPATTSGSAAATLANSGVTAAAYGDGGAARTLAFGGTFKVPGTLTVDAKGRITAAAAITLTMPAAPTAGAPTSHASTATTYGVATTANYGHAMASSATPSALGTASAGSNANKFAQEGHVHPLPSPLLIANGGTGATTQLAARQNMGGVIPTASPGTPASGYVSLYWVA